MTWQDDLHHSGIMMQESAIISAFSAGVNEKAAIVEASISVDTTSFCESLDSAIIALAPQFADTNNTAYSADLSELCSAAGYNTVVYGANAASVVLKNGGVRFNADYVAQRKDILDLFITGATTSEEYTAITGISIDHTPLFIINSYQYTCTITPSDATENVVWSVSSPTNANTINSTGTLTVLEDGAAQITAEAAHDSTTNATATAECYRADLSNNALVNAVAISGLTYTQYGVTMTHNSDGSVTLNGTTTEGDTSYIRFVIWPIGNNKSAHNVHLIMASPLTSYGAKYAVWYKYISGTVDFTKSTLTVNGHGTKAFEIYYMNNAAQLSTKIEHYVNNSGDRQDCDVALLSNNTKALTAVVFGYQVKKGTVFDNFTFKVGLSLVDLQSGQVYPENILDEGLLAPYHFSIIDYSKCIIARYPTRMFEIWASNYDNSGTMSLFRSSATPFQIGEVGHTYRFTVSLIAWKITCGATTTEAFMNFELRDSSSNVIASNPVFPVGYQHANWVCSNSEKTIEFVLTAPIADLVLHWYDTSFVQEWNNFKFSFEDITT